LTPNPEKTTEKYHGGRDVIREAQRFLRSEHPELKVDKYYVWDNHLLHLTGLDGFASVGQKFVLMDTSVLYSFREVVTTLSHELMHMTEGWRTFREGHERQIELKSERIGQEYFYGKALQ
jgi:hypothetical protein